MTNAYWHYLDIIDRVPEKQTLRSSCVQEEVRDGASWGEKLMPKILVRDPSGTLMHELG